MKKDDLKKIIETAYSPIQKGILTLTTGEQVRLKLTKLTLNNKVPYTPVTFMRDEITSGMRHFILAAGDGSYDLTKDLTANGIPDDYIVAIEPKIAPTEAELRRENSTSQYPHPTYNIPNIAKAFQRIKADPDIGIYRYEVIAPTSFHNSLCAVFIRVTENGAPTDLYLKRYFEVSDHRTYQNIALSKSDFDPVQSASIASQNDEDDQESPKNLLIFGAPGTGKSFAIQQKLRNPKWPNRAERVTFYEDYSYEKFVGSYVPKKAVKASEIRGSIDSQALHLKSTGDGITYEFVPGPFLKMAADAWMAHYMGTNVPHVLVIEEINRANAASVFGDMFQLLDRNDAGDSEYDITLSAEMQEWLTDDLKKRFEGTDYEESQRKTIENDIQDFAEHFRLPPNLYLWATMNSADQGVFPLDSAFKRRWSFLYKSILDNRTDNNQYLYTYVKDGVSPVFVTWDGLREAINKVMCSTENNVEEDRCLGAWYFKPAEMQQIFEYTKAGSSLRRNLPNPLCDKLFHYLRQDVFRNNPGAIFKENYHSMYEIRKALEEGTPLLNILNLPQDSLDKKITAAAKIPFIVEEGKQEVTLEKLAADLNIRFKEGFVFNMNNTLHKSYQLGIDTREKLIQETRLALTAGLSEANPLSYDEFCSKLKELPDEESGENSTGSDNTPAADANAAQRSGQ